MRGGVKVIWAFGAKSVTNKGGGGREGIFFLLYKRKKG